MKEVKLLAELFRQYNQMKHSSDDEWKYYNEVIITDIWIDVRMEDGSYRTFSPYMLLGLEGTKLRIWNS